MSCPDSVLEELLRLFTKPAMGNGSRRRLTHQHEHQRQGLVVGGFSTPDILGSALEVRVDLPHRRQSRRWCRWRRPHNPTSSHMRKRASSLLATPSPFKLGTSLTKRSFGTGSLSGRTFVPEAFSSCAGIGIAVESDPVPSGTGSRGASAGLSAAAASFSDMATFTFKSLRHHTHR